MRMLGNVTADAECLEPPGDGFVISALDRETLGPLLLAVERALVSLGYRHTGVHEVYVAPKFGGRSPGSASSRKTW